MSTGSESYPQAHRRGRRRAVFTLKTVDREGAHCDAAATATQRLATLRGSTRRVPHPSFRAVTLLSQVAGVQWWTRVEAVKARCGNRAPCSVRPHPWCTSTEQGAYGWRTEGERFRDPSGWRQRLTPDAAPASGCGHSVSAFQRARNLRHAAVSERQGVAADDPAVDRARAEPLAPRLRDVPTERRWRDRARQVRRGEAT